MKIHHGGKSYEINDSNFSGIVPKGAYALAYATHEITNRRGFSSSIQIEEYWVVLQSVFSHETNDFDVYYKWDIAKVFGETERESALKFKNLLTETASHITIVK